VADAGPDLSASDRIDTTVVHPARRYNYWLGGKDHFAADRASGDAVIRIAPHVRASALANRAFLGRAVRFVTEAGIRQFLDIGTGIPAPGNTHEVAQAVAPECRVVYVDNDPIVMAYARALFASTPAGRTACLQADLREGAAILSRPAVTDTLDLSQPVALVLVAVLHFLNDVDHPYQVVADLMARLAPGSYLICSHSTFDFVRPELRASLTEALGRSPIFIRTKEEVARFFTGLELVEPGIVTTAHWRPDGEPELPDFEAGIYAAVGHKAVAGSAT
jgi:hypothetical protein